MRCETRRVTMILYRWVNLTRGEQGALRGYGGRKMKEASRKEMKNQYKNSKQIGGVYRIRCDQAGESWVRASANLQGAKNRFAFQCTTNLCPEAAMSPAWKRYGAAGFTFEILEEIEKKETQTPREFSEDVSALLELWNEKQDDGRERIGTE